MQTIPSEIGELTQLQSLSLDENHLQNLPSQIAKLKNLKTLDLSGNRIKTLKEISTLTQLTELRLGRNGITELSPEIGELYNLRMLYLDDNKLSDLPSTLKNLRICDMYPLPGSILNVRRYFRNGSKTASFFIGTDWLYGILSLFQEFLTDLCTKV